jgi:hypothetical protein
MDAGSIAVLWAVSALLAAWIGGRKEAVLPGTFLGLLLGPLGVVAILAIDIRPRCFQCGGRLGGRPTICPRCQFPLGWIGDRPTTREEAAAYTAERVASEGGIQPSVSSPRLSASSGSTSESGEP